MSFIPKEKSPEQFIIEIKELVESFEHTGKCLACKLGEIDEIQYESDGIHALAIMGDKRWRIEIRSGYPVDVDLDGDLYKVRIEPKGKY